MKKLLFLFPKINRYPRFKPLINLTNQLTEGGNIVYIAVIGKVDAKVKSHFKPEVIFLEHPSGINKFRLAVKVLRDDFDFFIGVQSHNSYWLALAKLFLLSDKKIISWEHTSPYNALRNEYPKQWYVHLIIKYFFSLQFPARKFFIHLTLCLHPYQIMKSH